MNLKRLLSVFTKRDWDSMTDKRIKHYEAMLLVTNKTVRRNKIKQRIKELREL